ncbi:MULTISPECIES: stage II sporulation protein R [Oscillospiraceae]|uniref:stage II sporulation protein R n=1 Tax=Oscillospiraceae TaxID=216572 RepID=UPI001106E944|nr:MULTISPECIES: stage II sporulation protein R [Oscillospiraceae]
MEKRRNLIMAALAVMISLMLTACVWRTETVSAKVEKTQEHMAEEVLRFHVLANSDSKEDQNLKMKVKDTVVSWMEEEMDTESLAQTKAFIRSHLPQIEALAEETIQKEGYSYPVRASLEWTVFPEKTYGDITFPAGTYEALRIQIGEAQGHNWWCVLYPSLCFIDSVHAVVPEKGKKQLEHVLTEEEYEMVTATSKFKIRWFFFGS